MRKLDPAAYKHIEQYLEMKETMDKEHEYNKEIKSKRDMVIKYSDGIVVRLKWYKYGEHNLTFQDWDTKSFFSVPIEFDDDKLDNGLLFERFFQIHYFSVSFCWHYLLFIQLQ